MEAIGSRAGVLLRYIQEGGPECQRSGAVGACRAHNPEVVGSKLTFATGKGAHVGFQPFFVTQPAFFRSLRPGVSSE